MVLENTTARPTGQDVRRSFSTIFILVSVSRAERGEGGEATKKAKKHTTLLMSSIVTCKSIPKSMKVQSALSGELVVG